MVSGTVYHILLPILIDGSTTSPNMSRGTKSSSTAQTRPPIITSPLRPGQLRWRVRDLAWGAIGRAPERGRVFQLDTGISVWLPTKNSNEQNISTDEQTSKNREGQVRS